jgi:structural maintenance of chromosome 1
LAQQRELSKQKPRGKTDDALISEISRLESNITVAKDDLVVFLSVAVKRS